ncbi:MAG: hypothetical protein ABI785_02215 [Gemmatimonadales bacterium]
MSVELRDRLQAGLGATYALEKELGGGGMSRVFTATERSLDRTVVLKAAQRAGACHPERHHHSGQTVRSCEG